MIEIAKEPAGVPKTKIMYGAALSYAQLKYYLFFLVQNGLLEHMPYDKYRATEKGLEVLELYQRSIKLIGEWPDIQTPAQA